MQSHRSFPSLRTLLCRMLLGLGLLVSATASLAADAAPNQVRIDNFSFSPATLTVVVGTTVTWVNRSTFVHSVALADPRHTASGLLEPGQSFSVTFDTPGVFRFTCSPHPGMEGAITVTE